MWIGDGGCGRVAVGVVGVAGDAVAHAGPSIAVADGLAAWIGDDGALAGSDGEPARQQEKQRQEKWSGARQGGGSPIESPLEREAGIGQLPFDIAWNVSHS